MKFVNIMCEWIHLQTAKDGKYSVTLMPTAEQAEAIEAYLIGIWQDEFGEKKQPAWLGGKKELDNGLVRFVATKKAERKQDGEIIKQYVKVFNRKKQEIDAPAVANGAICNLSVTGFITEYEKKKGVSLFLNAVQLVEWTEYQSEDTFENLDGEEEQNISSVFTNEDIPF